jgi:TRAP-type C4-dicarboxylate transport system substrate-binding protein
MASYHPIGHPTTVATEHFATELEERSNGQIVCDYYPAQTLIKSHEIFEAVSSGRIEMGETDSNYIAGDIPSMQVMSLPGAFAGWQGLRDAMDGGLRDVYQKEYDKFGNTLLHNLGLTDFRFFNDLRPVLSPADTEGLKIKVAGKMFGDVIETVGGSAVMLPGPDLYMGLQRGTVDGAIWPAFCQDTYKTKEVTSYGTTNVSFGLGVHTVFVNTEWWQGLPDDVRSLILEVSDTLYESPQTIVENDEIAWKNMREIAGYTVSEASPAQVQAFADKLAPLIERSLNEFGAPAKELWEILAQYR